MTADAYRPAAPDGARLSSISEEDLLRLGGEDGALLAALPIGAAIFTLNDGRLWIEGINRRFLDLSGCAGAPETFMATFKRYEAGPGGAFARAFLADPAGAPDEMELVDGDGVARRYLKLKLSPLARSGAGGAPRCLMSVVDRTPEVMAERTLRAEMLLDSLTGLPNRQGFADLIETAIGEEDARHAVLVVDMRRFSRINESMGSMAGDELLITLARRLKSTLRSGDVLARTGGNEFGVLARIETGVEQAMAAAERIREVLTAPFRLGELEIRVECAIGLALTEQSSDPEELFRSAQFAVKQAKLAGRPQVYEPSEASAARRRFSIETELRRALDRDQLELFYQPLINLETGEVSGFEALARWTHEERGEISPTEFIPVAEESGLILQLGRWATDKAAATLARWDAEAGAPLPVHVGINLSAIQVARDNIAEMVGDALRSSGLSGDRLTIELTESSIVQDPARAVKVFEALKALDATVAMDDFGTGYSSLAYLQRLPIDVLKIDRSFVTGMLTDRDSVAIVRAVLGLADALGMSTTAEGIESVELATTLAALGCASGQGFYFARPLEADAALDYWRSRRRG
ncbi:EAL domain-containing protein [Sphingomonas sp. ASV193]|uniref:putative bifunctional diguanylate cyclase/phosphodiesterase n=1 Tax=Sphingomonas sp. ASV193 TaxID=3144405 RepID=UPI0032E8A5CF